ncbi:type II CRISPR-associated endonuclease Cas1 [Candidatus Saccharibacteria bacterium]|nr:type II CRISPR-associated endonuclease Cas1 [Candidatus Saccharibacteria bacterium]
MAWRSVVIENPAHLKLRDNKMIIRQEEDVAIPLEDISTLVLDSYGITISQNLLAELSSAGVSTVICDSKHLPSATLMPYSQASRGAKVAKVQLSLSAPTKKQLWRKNIIQKIANQAAILAKNNYPSEDLVELSRTVRSGDISNNESTAARIYFDRLLQDSTRRKPTWFNSALNYGYAIVRSNIARSIAAHGLIASVGINHHSELNQYNLVDDLIESFRPLVDDFIVSTAASRHISTDDFEVLSKTDRHLIVDILNQNVIIQSRKYPIRLATDIMVDSFVKAISEDDVDELLLPIVIS